MPTGVRREAAAARKAAPAVPEEEKAIDDMPGTVRDAAKRAFALRDRGAAVLDLVSDSLLDDLTQQQEQRELHFGTPDQPAAVTVRVRELANAVLLDIETDRGRVLEVQTGDQVVGAQELEDGRWTTPRIGHGLVSVVVQAGPQRARTAWLRV